jgi:hypothetical protein
MEKVIMFFLLIPPTHGHMCSAKDPDFKELRYPEQIEYCERNVSTSRKDDICLRDGVSEREGFTVDHIIPLSLGGDNSDQNLWCQHNSLSVTNIEYEAHLLLRTGEVSQKQAIKMVLDAKFNQSAD